MSQFLPNKILNFYIFFKTKFNYFLKCFIWVNLNSTRYYCLLWLAAEQNIKRQSDCSKNVFAEVNKAFQMSIKIVRSQSLQEVNIDSIPSYVTNNHPIGTEYHSSHNSSEDRDSGGCYLFYTNCSLWCNCQFYTTLNIMQTILINI